MALTKVFPGIIKKLRIRYIKAAEQVYDKAQHHITLMYTTGNGIPRDYVMAYAWFSLAASQEGEESKTTDSLFFLFMFMFGRYRLHL